MTQLNQKSVLAFAAFVVCMVLLSAYCTDRDGGSFGGDFDELVLQNPPYMLVHFGKLSFFELPVVAHPPIHVGWVGWLMRFGFSIYYAEATPTVLLLLLAIAVIIHSVFPTAIKLGLLFSIGFLAASGETLTLCFGTRPEGHVHAAWFLGLLLLESGRLASWDRARLFAGAFFLTWASGVHYYAAVAFLGVVVYVAWSVRDLGWRKSRSRIACLCGGGCLVGIPYLALFLIPHSREIDSMVAAYQGSGGVAQALGRHLELYREWAHAGDHPALIRLAMSAGIPLVIFSSAILVAIPSVRGMALAALPLQLFILLKSVHKPPFYLVHECVFFATAIALGLLVLAGRFAGTRAALAHRFPAVAAALLSVSLVWGNAVLPRAALSLKPKVHEAVIARAASREILGSNARVVGREAGWFVSGAEHWHDLQQDFSPGFLLYDPRTYFSNVDAVVDFTNNNQGPLTTWYADGTLQLRGFYFGRSSDQLRLVYLSATRPERVVGYVASGGRLQRFQEDAAGDFAVLSTACPINRTEWVWPYRSTASSILHFPSASPNTGQMLITILAPLPSLAPGGAIGEGCREVSRIAGTLQPVDTEALLAASAKSDSPIQFHQILDTMPGFSGMGLPASVVPPGGAVRVEGILDLSKAEASQSGHLERIPNLTVTLAPGLGWFSAFIHVQHPERVRGRCWVTLKVRVLSGHAGFAAYQSPKGFLARTPAIARTAEPQTIALEVPDLAKATDIVIFNASTLPGGLVEVLDAVVLVKPEDLRK